MTDTPAPKTPKTTKTPRRLPNGTLVGGNSGHSGGKKGRSGRKPIALKTLAEDLLSDPETKKSVRKILKDPDHRHFAAIFNALCDRAEGKAKQSVDLTSNGQTLESLVAASWGVTAAADSDGIAPTTKR